MISQRGMGEALGLGKSGSRLPRFVEGKAISNYVGPELREKLQQPLIFQAKVGGPETLTQVHGYDVTILIDICKAIIKAESEKKLLSHQANLAKQAHVGQVARPKSDGRRPRTFTSIPPPVGRLAQMEKTNTYVSEYTTAIRLSEA